MHLVIGLEIQSLLKKQNKTKNNIDLYNLTIQKQTMVTSVFVFRFLQSLNYL